MSRKKLKQRLRNRSSQVFCARRGTSSSTRATNNGMSDRSGYSDHVYPEDQQHCPRANTFGIHQPTMTHCPADEMNGVEATAAGVVPPGPSDRTAEPPRLLCGVCQSLFFNEQELETHRVITHRQYEKTNVADATTWGPGPSDTTSETPHYRCNEQGLETQKVFRHHHTVTTVPAEQTKRTPHRGPYFRCDECQSSFQREDDLQVHKLTVHHQADDETNGLGAAVTRGLTELTTKSVGAVTRGLSELTAAKPPPRARYQCKECQSTFFHADELEVHKLTAHYKDETVALPPYGGDISFAVVPPPSPATVLSLTRLGAFRGIQGENNSCYLDAALMALFYVDDNFDSLLQAPAAATGATSTSLHHNNYNPAHVEYARTYMTMHIINQLRQRGFVPSALVFEWRRMISFGRDQSANFDSHCQEEEASEFICWLVEAFGTTNGEDPLRFVTERRESSVSEKHLTQHPRPDPNGVSPQAYNNCQVLQPPAQSHQACETGANSRPCATRGEVMLQLLTPSYKNHEGAWTTEKLLFDTMCAEKLVFTKLGRSLVLQLPRYGKADRVIGSVVPSPTVYAYAETNGAADSVVSRCEKVRYELTSMLVIGQNHFVTYLRIPSKQGSKKSRRSDEAPFSWLYFDSMSNRIAEQNVPLIQDVTDQMQLLELPNAPTLVQNEMERPGREHLKRVVQDLSLAIYKRTEVVSEISTDHGSKTLFQGSWSDEGGEVHT